MASGCGAPVSARVTVVLFGLFGVFGKCSPCGRRVANCPCGRGVAAATTSLATAFFGVGHRSHSRGSRGRIRGQEEQWKRDACPPTVACDGVGGSWPVAQAPAE